ncbi:MAG: CHAD domain-containing protein [Chitinophagaceae bacterium]|nr:CHAD domain-containing protein [Chitinophagaceae bacterium]
MNKKRIQHITVSHYRKLEKLGNEMMVNVDPEELHQFRVCYKKLRAFLRMLSQESNHPGRLKISKQLKSCYHIAGTIRDMQLQQQWVCSAAGEAHTNLSAYLGLLQQRIEQLKPALGKMISHNPVAKNKKQVMAALPHRFSPAMFNASTRKKWEDIRLAITAGPFSDEAIHKIRKVMKDLCYVQSILKKCDRRFLKAIIPPGTEALDDLLEMLGNYQDKSMAINLMGPGWLKMLNEKGRQILLQEKRKLRQEKSNMRRLLTVTLKQTLQENNAGQT